MRKQMHWMLAATMLSVIGFVGAASVAREPAADAKPAQAAAQGKGSVSGVVMKDGKALPNVTVRLMHPREKGNGQKPGEKSVGPDGKKDKADKPTPIAETTTDDQGKFTMADVPAGEYVVVANLKEEGVGRVKVTVSDGQTASVSLTVEPRKSGGKSKGDKKDK